MKERKVIGFVGPEARTKQDVLTEVMKAAAKSWNRLAGFERLGQLIEGVQLINGVSAKRHSRTG